MANLQKYFEEFHEKIRTDYEMNDTLREKRDKIVERIRSDFKKNKRPGFEELLQGSFAIKTGVVPIGRLEYDIDVGLRVRISEDQFTAQEVHQWVFDAVDGHTETVESRGPCVRVKYAEGYHVDLVPYAWWEDQVKVQQYRLAHKSNGWRQADPPGLLEFVRSTRQQYEGTEDSRTGTDQFRRCVRYLRRWDDVAIPNPSRAKPTGLAFVLLMAQILGGPRKSYDGTPDDRKALEELARQAGAVGGRLSAVKPTPEYEDILLRLSNQDMEELKERLRTLADRLAKAGAEPDPVKACKSLQELFGPDFPVPSPEDTGKKTSAPTIITSSASA